MEQLNLFIIMYYFFSALLFGFCIRTMYIKEVTENRSITENKEERPDEKKELQKKEEPKYEDKYLEDIRRMDPEFNFTDEEKTLEELKYNEILKSKKDEYENKINSIKKEIDEKKNLLEKLNENNSPEEDEEEFDEEMNDLLYDIQNGERMLKDCESNKQTDEEIESETRKEARDFTLKNRLLKLKNSFIMEKTPLGNVIMYYNVEKETFEYYSDNTIPYRFLEVVGRKYVRTFDCRPIYVDMEAELKIYEKKLEEKEIQDKIEAEKEKTPEEKLLINKSKVFAKFKSYNKEAGSGRVNKAPPPKNSIPSSAANKNKNPNEKIILKERANRYTYEGRFANFSVLKKVPRKQVDKKYAMSFAEFKKMQKK